VKVGGKGQKFSSRELRMFAMESRYPEAELGGRLLEGVPWELTKGHCTLEDPTADEGGPPSGGKPDRKEDFILLGVPNPENAQ